MYSRVCPFEVFATTFDISGKFCYTEIVLFLSYKELWLVWEMMSKCIEGYTGFMYICHYFCKATFMLVLQGYIYASSDSLHLC